MSQERNDLKEATFDPIVLEAILKSQERSRTWDLGIFAVGLVNTGIVLSFINIEPQTSTSILWFVPAIVPAGAAFMIAFRNERIEDLMGQIVQGIEMQARRTASL